ncbi:hypothetical protein [uncultured Aquimarina sp.]|uniref:hypothetical protein n=1 Tax=uncultured Aquimarina sp. TaxID=575652 RepID=UPI0026225329|nr:hypothetical protein [uncultured Aquimarina sp.]
MFRKTIFFFLVFSSTISSAQRIKIDKKKLEFLKNETKVDVQLTFPKDMTFFRDLMSEQEFIAYMQERRNTKKSSKGAKWLESYKIAKQTTWQNDFLSSINNELKKYSDLRFTNSDDETNYLLIIEGDWLYPGYGGGASVAREEAKLEVTLKFIKKSDPKTILYSTTTPKIIGNYAYGEFGTILRTGECYKKLGYLLNLQLKRIVK